jgi:hypothetical protein
MLQGMQRTMPAACGHGSGGRTRATFQCLEKRFSGAIRHYSSQIRHCSRILLRTICTQFCTHLSEWSGCTEGAIFQSSSLLSANEPLITMARAGAGEELLIEAHSGQAE